MCFLDDGAESAAPHAHEVLDTRALDPLLLTDLATDRDTGPQVEEWHELGEGAQDATVSDGLCVLPEDVARAEVGDDARGTVIEAAEDSVTPLARHDADCCFRERGSQRWRVSGRDPVANEKQISLRMRV